MMNSVDRRELESLREETLRVLADALKGERSVALLDVPNQRNVGDSLILEGEIEYLKALGVRLKYVSDLRSYNRWKLRALMPSGVVLLHGGGNFGDVWESHQAHRERIVQDLPDYRVIQLPQSVYFESDQRAKFANGIIGAHPDFLLMIRDELSAARARQQLPDVATVFCPDMALGWRAPQFEQPGPGRGHLLVLARTDRESSSQLSRVDAGWVPGIDVHRVDWQSSGTLERQWRVARSLTHIHRCYVRAHRFLPKTLDEVINRRYWAVLRRLSSINIEGGVNFYRHAEAAVVDRLHAHVLASLVGIDHVLLDNSYGKLSSVYDGYTGRFSTANYAHDIVEAREITKKLLNK